MKHYLAKAVPGTALAGILLLSATTWAIGGSERGFEPSPGHMVEHLAERLELTAEQREEIRAILEASAIATEGDRARLNEVRAQMKALAREFDAGTAQQNADEIGQITSRLAFESAETHAEVYAVLTDEQRAQMEAFATERGERRDWHRERLQALRR